MLIFISLMGAIGPLMSHETLSATREAALSFIWRGEQALISGMMLVVGLGMPEKCLDAVQLKHGFPVTDLAREY